MVKVFMDKKGVGYPVFMVEQDVLDKYYAGMERILVPYNVFIGRDGKQAMSELGYNKKKQKEMEEEIARLLKGQSCSREYIRPRREKGPGRRCTLLVTCATCGPSSLQTGFFCELTALSGYNNGLR